MIKKLTKHGNSYAIIINKPIMELLGIDASTELDFKINGQELTISRAGGKLSDFGMVSKDKKIQKAYEQAVSQYDALLKKLAQN